MKNRRTRVTVSLPSELVQLIDRCSKELRETRSGLIEEWLRRAARQNRLRELDDEISEYYSSQSDDERGEAVSIAEASGRLAARLSYDDTGKPSRKRR